MELKIKYDNKQISPQNKQIVLPLNSHNWLSQYCCAVNQPLVLSVYFNIEQITHFTFKQAHVQRSLGTLTVNSLTDLILMVA